MLGMQRVIIIWGRRGVSLVTDRVGGCVNIVGTQSPKKGQIELEIPHMADFPWNMPKLMLRLAATNLHTFFFLVCPRPRNHSTPKSLLSSYMESSARQKIPGNDSVPVPLARDQGPPHMPEMVGLSQKVFRFVASCS